MNGEAKQCTRCKVLKPIDEFSVSKVCPEHGRTKYCNKCKHWKRMKFQTPEGQKQAAKERASPASLASKLRYQASAKGKINRQRFRATPKGKMTAIREWKRIHNDPQLHRTTILRMLLRRLLNGKQKTTGKWHAYLGFSNVREFRSHFARQLPKTASLQDLEIDHIIAMHHYDMLDPEDARRCNSLCNMQLLRQEDNGSKGTKLPSGEALLQIGKEIWPKAWNGIVPH